jgi:hypothetical protein
MLDEAGIAMEMHKDLVNPLARHLAQQIPTDLQKMYLIQNTHRLH